MKTGRDGYSHSYLGLDTKLLILTVSLTMIGHGQACLNTGTHGLLGLKPPPNQSKKGGQGGCGPGHGCGRAVQEVVQVPPGPCAGDPEFR